MHRSRWVWLMCWLIAGCWCFITPTALADTADAITAPPLFVANCAGCHVNGGNIVRRGKTLKQRALKRNKVDSVEAIANLIENGKGAMSAYGDRLSPEAIDLLANYVWERAQNNWK